VKNYKKIRKLKRRVKRLEKIIDDLKRRMSNAESHKHIHVNDCLGCKNHKPDPNAP
jgi:ppGpp synthetase/RelA/SpoT-type nucleotidyltranferase